MKKGLYLVYNTHPVRNTEHSICGHKLVKNHNRLFLISKDYQQFCTREPHSLVFCRTCSMAAGYSFYQLDSFVVV